ncbi:MAG: SPOR domain-containing protein, partial [Ignavibacteria bacterium]
SQQPSTRSSANALQEWCVQVFASTNADDADEWNDRLRTKNVYDSRIEIVDRQGQTWYRVRFGRFASRQEAEQSALGMGFRNAWVNRTR